MKAGTLAASGELRVSFGRFADPRPVQAQAASEPRFHLLYTPLRSQDQHLPVCGRLRGKELLSIVPRMKKDIHPADYRKVIFEDTTSGARFLVGSTVRTEETAKWDDGKEYPRYEVEISSASHPFYTGQSRSTDTTGRLEKFRARAAAAKTGK